MPSFIAMTNITYEQLFNSMISSVQQSKHMHDNDDGIWV